MLRRRHRPAGPGRRAPSRSHAQARGLDRLRIAAARRLPRHAGRIFAAAFLFVLVTVEVTIQVVHSSGSADRMAATTWSTAIAPIVAESNTVGASVEHIRTDAAKMSRLTLQEDLGTVVTETRDTQTELDTIGLSPPSPQAVELLAAVLADRAQAATLLTGGIDVAIGPGSETEATSQLEQAGQAMIVADDMYQRFVSSVPTADGRSLLTPSTWIADSSQWDGTTLAPWVASLHAAPALASRQALALVAVSIEPPIVRVAGLPTTTTTTTTTSTSTTTTTTSTTTTTTVPGQSTTSTSTTVTLPPQSTTTTTTLPPTTTTLQTLPPGAISVLPPTTTIQIVVVVADAGDTAEQGVVVTATLEDKVPGAKGSTSTVPAGAVQRLVGAMSPGDSRYLVLPALKVAVGATYVLTVAAGGTGAAGPGGAPTDTFTVYIA